MKKAFWLRVFPSIIDASGHFGFCVLILVYLVRDPDLSAILYSLEMTDEILFGSIISIFFFCLIGFVSMVCEVIRQSIFIARDSHVSSTEEVQE